MGKVKQYISNIAEFLNKKFEDVTESEFNHNWAGLAQEAYAVNALDKEIYKNFLPTIPLLMAGPINIGDVIEVFGKFTLVI